MPADDGGVSEDKEETVKKAFKNVLCPVDFSAYSRRALSLAMTLADDEGTPLRVLHVLERGPFSFSARFPLAEALHKARERLAHEVSSVEDALERSPAVETEVFEGRAPRVILDRVREEGIDLVVMGTHGRSGLEGLLLGAVTDKVLHQIDVPLIAVRAEEKARLELAPPFRVILVAVDFGPSSAASAHYARDLAARYGSLLIGLNVAPRPEDHWGVNGPLWLSDEERERRVGQERPDRLERLARFFPAAEAGVAPELLVEPGAPWDVVSRIARERKADLIVAGAHGLGKSEMRCLGSTTHRIIRVASCPVLVVRAPANGGSFLSKEVSSMPTTSAHRLDRLGII